MWKLTLLILIYCFIPCENSLAFNYVEPVYIGDTAYLICNVTNENYYSLAWYRVYNTTISQSIWFLNIFINSSYSSKYSVSTDNPADPTLFQLTIDNVQSNEFGEYECRRNGGGATAKGVLSLKTTISYTTQNSLQTTTLLTTTLLTTTSNTFIRDLSIGIVFSVLGLGAVGTTLAIVIKKASISKLLTKNIINPINENVNIEEINKSNNI